MNSTERPWRQVWPQGMPHHIEVSRPVTEYLRETAAKQPQAVAIDFQGRLIS
jgi:hypothetical protein